MTIEITNPDLEALIRERLKAGAYRDPEDLIREVLGAPSADPRTGADLIEAMQACPHPEVDIGTEGVDAPLARDTIF